MRQRATSESKPVGLFPFLAVLLCTMGALLVLLVVLAQRAGERVLAQQPESTSATEPSQEPAHELSQQDSAEADTLAEQLQQVLDRQEELRKLREQGEQRLQEEQLRLSHLEEHTRRIEHELARLSLAAEQLKATENNQSVDQQQAENQLARLNKLIEETEKQLEELRNNATGKRSYAIVPYKGPNGTFRQPVYIECCKDGVIIRPEGIRFNSNDFAAPNWPGNPLAAALRASREYLNAKAARAGQPEPPDPYPLLIVRPDGIAQYQVARIALASWDADFGYEFVDSDWQLEFPDLPDPQLAQLQHHAQLNAREQLARLVRAAPSKYRGIGVGGSGSMASGGTSGSDGYGAGGPSGDPDSSGLFGQSSEGDFIGGQGSTAGQSLADSTAANGDSQFGGLGDDSDATGNTSQSDQTDSFANATGTGPSASGEKTGANKSADGEAGQAGGQGSDSAAAASGLAQAGSQPAGVGAMAAAGSSGSSGGSPSGGNPSGSSASAPSLNMSSQSVKSIAESQGKNWAISEGARGAVPIRRPIQVVLRKDRLTLLPSRHALRGVEATGTLISLNQPTRQVSAEFVDALRTRVDGWGLAGNGLYWRPVLNLHVGPEAEATARGLAKLLQDSGVEVQRQEPAPTGTSIQALKGDRENATR